MADVTRQNSVWKQLTTPEETIDLSELLHRWKAIDIVATIRGYGAVSIPFELYSNIRGAVGRHLMRSASPESINGGSCPWEPPCTNDILFGPKPELRVGRHLLSIPKPFVLLIDRNRDDLVITVRLLGSTQELAREIRASLVAALREGIDWARFANDTFLPTPTEIEVRQRECVIRTDLSDSISHVELEFITPIDCKNGDPVERPEIIFSRIATRTVLLARWQGVKVEVDWLALSNAWRALQFDNVDPGKSALMKRKSTRTRQVFSSEGRLFSMTVTGDMALVWPLLAIGENTHVGRGTTYGLGRFTLMPA